MWKRSDEGFVRDHGGRNPVRGAEGAVQKLSGKRNESGRHSGEQIIVPKN